MRKPFRIVSRKSWYIRVPRGDGTGKLRLVKLGTTRREAMARWERLKQSMAMAAVDGSNTTVAHLINEYGKWMRRRVEDGQLANSTRIRRLDYLASFLQSIPHETPSHELKVHHITRWLDAVRTWNPNTRYYAGVAVKRVFNWCVQQEILTSNPLAQLKLQKGESRDYLVSAETLEKLRVGSSDPMFHRPHVIAFRTLLTALSLSGCRPGEVAGIQVENCYNDRWVLPKHKTKKKKGTQRVVWLCPCLQTLTRIAKHGRTQGPLFRPNHGESWTYEKMRRRFERLRKRVGVDPACVLYSFRHTSITNGLLANINVATVAEMHGTSIQMIENNYGHLCQHNAHLTRSALQLAKMRHRVEK